MSRGKDSVEGYMQAYGTGSTEAQPASDRQEGEYVRQNEGKAKLSYILMFPNAITAVSLRMGANEDKYPNDKFCDYDPDEVMDSLLRHATALKSPYTNPLCTTGESGLDHLAAIVFNSLCLLESSLVQQHRFIGDPDNG